MKRRTFFNCLICHTGDPENWDYRGSVDENDNSGATEIQNNRGLSLGNSRVVPDIDNGDHCQCNNEHGQIDTSAI